LDYARIKPHIKKQYVTIFTARLSVESVKIPDSFGKAWPAERLWRHKTVKTAGYFTP
jgi:hypothetical protein